MAVTLAAEETINIGEPVVVEGPSHAAHYGAVFEDDGTTAYLYGLDFQNANQPIVDARHIYNSHKVADRDMPSVVQIVWSQDGLKTALLINGYPHAVIDFSVRRSYCRSGFPPAQNWSKEGVEWDDSVAELFK